VFLVNCPVLQARLLKPAGSFLTKSGQIAG
jgi:hypothetical protein